MKISTGLRNAMLDAASLKGAMTGALIYIYGGTVPATADAADTGATLLCTISTGGDGTTALALEAAAASGVITKETDDTWSGTVDTSGTAAFFRMKMPADGGSSSTSEKRIQGTIALAGADMNLSSTSLVAAATQTIDYFSVALPAE